MKSVDYIADVSLKEYGNRLVGHVLASLEGDFCWNLYFSNYQHDVVAQARRVHLVVDYDVDGLAAGAILYQYLDSRGVDISVKTFSRYEGFGVKPEHLRKDRLNIILDRGSPEVGSGVYDGFDVVIIDHHDCGGKPEPNVMLVNPRLTETTKYPSSSLISHRLWGNRGNLPLALLGTLGDVSVLDRETHEQLYSQWEDETPWGRFVSPEGVRFDLIPKLNACGRVGDSRVALDYLINPSRTAWRTIKDIHKRRKQEAERLQPVKVVTLPNVVFAQYPHSASGHISYFAQRYTRHDRVGVAGYLDPTRGYSGYRVSIRSNFPCLGAVYDTRRFPVGGHANAGGGFIPAGRLGEFLDYLDSVVEESKGKWAGSHHEISPRDLESPELIEALERVCLNPPPLFRGSKEWLDIEKICRQRRRPASHQGCLHWGTPQGEMVCSVSSFRKRVSVRWHY